MSQSGVFNLVVEDERYDQFLTASGILRDRIAEIIALRTCQGLKNPQPTFADLEQTHVLFLRAQYRPYVAVASEYVRVKSSGSAAKLTTTGTNTLDFTFPIYGNFTSDMVFHVRTSAVGTQTPTASDPYYRFCAFPGIRLLAKTSFTSDQITIDDYESGETSFINKFGVTADQRPAWNRGMGQAEEREGTYHNDNGYTGKFLYSSGLQTPKQYHPATDMWIPAQFFLGRDVSSALYNDLVPNTQRKVSVALETLRKMVFQYTTSVGGSTDPFTQQTLGLTELDLTVDLYVNNLFVNPEINDIFASRIAFTLVRIHRRQLKTLTKSTDSILLDQMKYPVEYMYAGFRSKTQASDPDQWHLYGRPPTFTDPTRILAPAAVWNAGAAMNQLVFRDVKPTSTLDKIVTSVTLTAHGIDLFPSNLPRSFFSDYLPQRYASETLITSSTDSSAMFVTFCLYPGKHNPSGYYNLSAARELYFKYSASDADISLNNQAELYVSASTLNFIVRKGDSVMLRYSL